MKEVYKYDQFQYYGEGPLKDATLMLTLNPGDEIEIDTTAGRITNKTTNTVSRIRDKEFIATLPARLNATKHYTKVTKTDKKSKPDKKGKEEK